MSDDNVVNILSGKEMQLQKKLSDMEKGIRENASRILSSTLTEDSTKFILDHTTSEQQIDFVSEVTDLIAQFGDKVVVPEPEMDEETRARLIGYYRENLKTMSSEEAALLAVKQPWIDQEVDPSFFEEYKESLDEAATVLIGLSEHKPD